MKHLDALTAFIERHPLLVAAAGWGLALYLLGLVVGLMIGGHNA